VLEQEYERGPDVEEEKETCEPMEAEEARVLGGIGGRGRWDKISTEHAGEEGKLEVKPVDEKSGDTTITACGEIITASERAGFSSGNGLDGRSVRDLDRKVKCRSKKGLRFLRFWDHFHQCFLNIFKNRMNLITPCKPSCSQHSNIRIFFILESSWGY
jgi:hypothetical protein